MRRLRFALLLSRVAAAAIEAGLEAPRSFGAGFHPVDVVTGECLEAVDLVVPATDRELGAGLEAVRHEGPPEMCAAAAVHRMR